MQLMHKDLVNDKCFPSCLMLQSFLKIFRDCQCSDLFFQTSAFSKLLGKLQHSAKKNRLIIELCSVLDGL